MAMPAQPASRDSTGRINRARDMTRPLGRRLLALLAAATSLARTTDSFSAAPPPPRWFSRSRGADEIRRSGGGFGGGGSSSSLAVATEGDMGGGPAARAVAAAATASAAPSAESRPGEAETREAGDAEPAERPRPSPPPPPPPPPSSSSSSMTGPFSTSKAGVRAWEEMEGNYLLRPPAESEPRALIHFLGGALIGAAPDVAYRYILERLSANGYLIVATPYNLSFDHLKTCDEVISKFERIAPSLARQYGAVPVVGMGHSCGALLQLLITSLFPDTPRAANALLSYNNKPVKEAVPLFDEVVAPFFKSVAAKNDAGLPSGTDVMYMTLRLARAATEGELPSDRLINDFRRFVTPQFLSPLLRDEFSLPNGVRDAFQTFVGPTSAALEGAGLLPVMNQAVDVLDQIPMLVDEVADGANDFNPLTSSVRAAARRAYRARRTLLLQYDDDPLDESEEIEELLREAETVMRMKRPMISIDIQREVIKGTHATPILAPPVDVAERAEDILGAETAKERLLYAEADATVEVLVRWLEEGQL